MTEEFVSKFESYRNSSHKNPERFYNSLVEKSPLIKDLKNNDYKSADLDLWLLCLKEGYDDIDEISYNIINRYRGIKSLDLRRFYSVSKNQSESSKLVSQFTNGMCTKCRDQVEALQKQHGRCLRFFYEKEGWCPQFLTFADNIISITSFSKNCIGWEDGPFLLAVSGNDLNTVKHVYNDQKIVDYDLKVKDPEIYSWLIEKGILKQISFLEKKNKEFLKAFVKENPQCVKDESILESFYENQFDRYDEKFLKALLKQGFYVSEKLIKKIIEKDDFQTLEILEAHVDILHLKDLINYTFKSIECMKFLRGKSFYWNEYTARCVAKYGTMEVFSYCIKNGCPIDSTAAMEAAREKNVEILLHILEKNLPWDFKMVEVADEEIRDIIAPFVYKDKISKLYEEYRNCPKLSKEEEKECYEKCMIGHDDFSRLILELDENYRPNKLIEILLDAKNRVPFMKTGKKMKKYFDSKFRKMVEALIEKT